MSYRFDNAELADLALDAARAERQEARDAQRHMSGFTDCHRHDYLRARNRLVCTYCGDEITESDI